MNIHILTISFHLDQCQENRSSLSFVDFAHLSWPSVVSLDRSRFRLFLMIPLDTCDEQGSTKRQNEKERNRDDTHAQVYLSKNQRLTTGQSLLIEHDSTDMQSSRVLSEACLTINDTHASTV